MTPKQERFVAAYLANGMNATQAAITAGYSEKSARSIGEENLTKPDIAKAIDASKKKALGRLEITAERVLEEIALMAFSNMSDYITIGADGQADVDLSSLTRAQAAAIQEISVDATGGAGDGERRKVLRTRFKLGDKRGCLELLGKHLKLFTDKTEVTGADGGPLETSIAVRFVEADGK